MCIQKILDWLGVEQLIDNALNEHALAYHTSPPPVPTPEGIFDPKNYEKVEEYPLQLGGWDIGFAIVGSRDSPIYLKKRLSNGQSYPYENPDWVDDPSNLKGQRIEVQPGKILAVLAPKYKDFGDAIDRSYDKPYPFIFDGGGRCLRVMGEQFAAGHLLQDVPENLFIDIRDTADTWMPSAS